MTNTINTPLTLPSGLEIPNRLVKAAMSEHLANQKCQVTERHIKLYQAWAGGGIGLQITGNVQVDIRNLEGPGNIAIDGRPSVEHAAMLEKWAEASKSGGGKVIMQLSHAGRQTMKLINAHPKAPSAVAVKLPGGQFGQPRAMSGDDVKAAIEAFGTATRAARQAGFDGVQIHGAHGYLINQFLSPLSNQRDDEWGGALENRARFLIEVVTAVKAEAGPGFAVALKLNSTDFQKGGFSRADSKAVIEMLNDLTLDFVEISGGNYEQPKMMDLDGIKPVFEDGTKASTRKREAYFLDYAREVQQHAAMPIMITGGFRTRAAMDEAVAQGDADLIGLARPLCVDVEAPAKLLSHDQDELEKWESILRIGPGWIGPKSPFGVVKALNGFGAMAWFYRQMHAIADGEPVNRNLGVLKAFIASQGADARLAKAYHKALVEN